MPLFRIDGDNAVALRARNFSTEKELQSVVERNLETIFGCRFVATEFSTGERHGGRIDSLALSEDGNPVIIEYKKQASSDLLNQSLFYLSWIRDHRGDYEIAVRRQLGDGIEVDWSDVRVICIAPNYKRYDLHAVGMMGANIELWQYHYFEDGSLYLEEAYRKAGGATASEATTAREQAASGKNPVMVAAGKLAAQTRATGEYSIDDHVEKAKHAGVGELFARLREHVNALSDSIEEAPKKYYVAYKVAKNFLCVESRTSKLVLYLKLDPPSIEPLPSNARDVREIGHYGTGDLEVTVRTPEELDRALLLVDQALDEIGE